MEVAVRYPMRLENVVFEDQGEGLIVVLEPTQGLLLLTNHVGRRVLELSDGTRSLENIKETLVAEYKNAPAERVDADVVTFLARAEAKGVVKWKI